MNDGHLEAEMPDKHPEAAGLIPLPKLPEPLLEGVDYELWGQNVTEDCYTAKQMQAYAREHEAEVTRRLAAKHERVRINYAVLHEFADATRISYNGLCTAVRAALSADPAPMRKATRDEKIARPGVYEVPADPAPPAQEPKSNQNPWREFIESVIAGGNEFRLRKWHDLMDDLDRLYASPPAPAAQPVEPSDAAQPPTPAPQPAPAQKPVAWIDPADFETLEQDGWCVVHAAQSDPGADHAASIPLYAPLSHPMTTAPTPPAQEPKADMNKRGAFDGSPDAVIQRLRANLRVVTDAYEMLLDEGRFPPKGRSQDDQDATVGWWERAGERIRQAREALATEVADTSPTEPAAREPAPEWSNGLRRKVHEWHERAVALGADGIELVIHAAEVAKRRGELRTTDGVVTEWVFPKAAARDSGAVQAWADVLAERKRHIEHEGFTPAHDDSHAVSELAAAAGCYALFADAYPNRGEPPVAWPWEAAWWKPKDFRRDSVRAAALLLAGIEAYDRRAAATPPHPTAEGEAG